MATTRTFQDMLNEYLTYDLLKEEFIKRDYILRRVAKDDGWKSGTLPVPFKGAYASTVKFGSLTAEADIGEDEYVRGQITSQPEVWGSMKFNQKDLIQHDGKVNEKSFLKLLPDSLDDFMDTFRCLVSQHLLNDNLYLTVTADGTAGGVLAVDRVERAHINQRLILNDDGTVGATTVYVIGIDINAETITVSATKGGAALNVSTYLVANDAILQQDGTETAGNRMTSLRRQLLSAANGGDATLYGQTKLAYPFLQALNFDGSTITASNIVEKVFDFFVKCKRIGKGKPNELLVSFKNLGSIMKLTESTKGPYKVTATSKSAALYDWMAIDIAGPEGMLRVVGINEMDDDVMFMMDWRGVKFHSNGFIRKRTAPDGKQWYEVRQTTGYYYIVDMFLMGDLVLTKPSHCGVIHSISY